MISFDLGRYGRRAWPDGGASVLTRMKLTDFDMGTPGPVCHSVPGEAPARASERAGLAAVLQRNANASTMLPRPRSSRSASAAISWSEIVMAQVIARHLEDEMVRRLKDRVPRKGHSLEQELREILAAAARQDVAEFKVRAAAIRALRGHAADRQRAAPARRPRPVNLVIEASVAIKWFAPEVPSGEAERLLDGGDALFRAGLPPGRVRQHHLEDIRLGELARPDDDDAVAALRSGSIDLVDTTSLVERVLQLPLEIDHPISDCLYLAAEVCDATLVVADRRFSERCSQSIMRSRIGWLPIGHPGRELAAPPPAPHGRARHGGPPSSALALPPGSSCVGSDVRALGRVDLGA